MRLVRPVRRHSGRRLTHVLPTCGPESVPSPVVVSYAAPVGVIPPVDAAAEESHVGTRAEQIGSGRAAMADRDRKAAGEEGAEAGGRVIGVRADKQADRRAAEDRARRAKEKRGNVLRAERERVKRAAQQTDPAVAGTRR